METSLVPKFSDRIAICFACDNNYVPYFSVALVSLYKNSDKSKNYDIVVLDEDVSEENKKIILSYQKPNFNIRFFNMKEYLSSFDTNIFYVEKGSHYTIHTYYRFFITEIFKDYDKVIYLDSDVILLEDISNLYDTDMKGCYLSATKDIHFSMLVKINFKIRRYYKEILKMSDLKNYFQAGVLIFNIPYCIENGLKEKLLDTINEVKKPLIVDQDILNKVCEYKVKYIDGKWNFDTNVTVFQKQNKNILENTYNAKEIKLINEIMAHPKIVHFAGEVKPWYNLFLMHAMKYWKYILQSKYKTYFIKKLILQQIKNIRLLLILTTY